MCGIENTSERRRKERKKKSYSVDGFYGNGKVNWKCTIYEVSLKDTLKLEYLLTLLYYLHAS